MLIYNRKVAGETKDKGHGAADGVFKGDAVPLRRWEDWERSRLRKLRREDRRRKELGRAHPGGFQTGDGELLSVFSTYEGSSDTHSIASSEEDKWGMQIGEYNELNPAYPPPPTALLDPDRLLEIGTETLRQDELAAILQTGFGPEGPEPSTSNPASPTGLPATYHLPRHRSNDWGTPPAVDGNGYVPIPRTTSPRSRPPNGGGYNGYGMTQAFVDPTSPSSATGFVADFRTTHARRRSGGPNAGEKYGPLGPLGPTRNGR
jgi:chitin synthase